MKKIIFIDLETTGLPTSHHIDPSEVHHWPYIVEIAWLITDYDSDKVLKEYHAIIKPSGYEIPKESTKIHKISNKQAIENGTDIKNVVDELIIDLENSTILVAHNISFDANVLRAAFHRLGYDIDIIDRLKEFCTMENFTEYCKIPNRSGYDYKWPTLDQLHQKVLGSPMMNKHSAMADVYATKLCFYQLKNENYFDILTEEEVAEKEKLKEETLLKIAEDKKALEQKNKTTFIGLFFLTIIFVVLIGFGIDFIYCLLITFSCWLLYYFGLGFKNK